jgi:putative nucleotidyltransferase with HDIG domain
MMKTSVIAYVYAIVAAAVASTATLFVLHPSFEFSLFLGAAVLAGLGVLGARTRYRVQGNTFGEVSFIPYLSGLVLYPHWSTVLLVAAGAVLAEAGKKKPLVKRAFNVAQFTLAASLAGIAYLKLGGVSLQVDKSFETLPHTLAVVSFLVVNTLSVAAVIGLAEGRSILKTWYHGNSAGIVYDVVAIPVVYVFARVYVDWGPWGAVALGVLIYGLRQTYQTKHQLSTTNRELLELFVHTVEFRDPYTSGHSQRVARFSKVIARAVGLSPREVDRIGVAALLHDVGKIHEIFAPILSKPGRLTDEERATMELHPIKSAELVAKLSELQDIVPDVRHHHERWDGAGYPDRLAGKSIPLGARIIAFADTIDAMTTDRPYRKAMGEKEVRDELLKMRGKQFDPQICDLLLQSEYYSEIFRPTDTRSISTFTQIFDRARRPKTPAVA